MEFVQDNFRYIFAIVFGILGYIQYSRKDVMSDRESTRWNLFVAGSTSVLSYIGLYFSGVKMDALAGVMIIIITGIAWGLQLIRANLPQFGVPLFVLTMGLCSVTADVTALVLEKIRDNRHYVMVVRAYNAQQDVLIAVERAVPPVEQALVAGPEAEYIRAEVWQKAEAAFDGATRKMSFAEAQRLLAQDHTVNGGGREGLMHSFMTEDLRAKREIEAAAKAEFALYEARIDSIKSLDFTRTRSEAEVKALYVEMQLLVGRMLRMPVQVTPLNTSVSFWAMFIKAAKDSPDAVGIALMLDAWLLLNILFLVRRVPAEEKMTRMIKFSRIYATGLAFVSEYLVIRGGKFVDPLWVERMIPEFLLQISPVDANYFPALALPFCWAISALIMIQYRYRVAVWIGFLLFNTFSVLFSFVFSTLAIASSVLDGEYQDFYGRNMASVRYANLVKYNEVYASFTPRIKAAEQTRIHAYADFSASVRGNKARKWEGGTLKDNYLRADAALQKIIQERDTAVAKYLKSFESIEGLGYDDREAFKEMFHKEVSDRGLSVKLADEPNQWSIFIHVLLTSPMLAGAALLNDLISAGLLLFGVYLRRDEAGFPAKL